MSKIFVNRVAFIIYGLLIGALIGVGAFFGAGAISAKYSEQVVEFTSAFRPTEDDQAILAANTNTGNSWLVAPVFIADAVKTEFIDGEFMRVVEEYQEYRMHTQTSTDSNGNTTTTTYWSWDTMNYNIVQAKYFFCMGVRGYAEQLLDVPNNNNKTVDLGHHRRVIVYTKPAQFEGTLYSYLWETENQVVKYHGALPDEVIASTDKKAAGWNNAQPYLLGAFIIIGIVGGWFVYTWYDNEYGW